MRIPIVTVICDEDDDDDVALQLNSFGKKKAKPFNVGIHICHFSGMIKMDATKLRAKTFIVKQASEWQRCAIKINSLINATVMMCLNGIQGNKTEIHTADTPEAFTQLT